MGKRDVATEDVDTISAISAAVRQASEEFAEQEGLRKTWFNDRARTVRDYLKHGYGVDSTEALFVGKALILKRPSLENLLISKLCAVVDRPGNEQDLADLRNLEIDRETFERCAAHFLRKERAGHGDEARAEELLDVAKSLIYGDEA
jgi:hypothetical protein